MKKSLERLEASEVPVSRDHRETLAHGSKQFRMSVHKTTVPARNKVVLYAHWHEELEFLFLVKGRALVHIGQEKLTVQSGDVVFIPPNLLHSASRLDQEEIVFYAVLVHFHFLSSLENDRIQQDYLMPLFEPNGHYPLLITREMDKQRQLYSQLESICEVYRQEPPGYELLIKARLLEAVYRMQTYAALATDAAPATRPALGVSSLVAKKVLAYVQQNYSKRISLADMAGHVNLSPAYFCRLMKKQFDLSPMDFLNEYRVGEAIRLMETTEKKITEIAGLTGFSNINRFTEIFKKRQGCAPGHYRRTMRHQREATHHPKERGQEEHELF